MVEDDTTNTDINAIIVDIKLVTIETYIEFMLCREHIYLGKFNT